MDVRISARFNGPPASANGGYACGIVAEAVGGDAEVTLRAPPPLETPLELREEAGGRVVLAGGGGVVAEGRPARPAIDLPDPPSLEEAETASRAYAWRRGHPFPTCFVCGPERTCADGDGLCIFPGPLGPLVASAWTPPLAFARGDGVVDTRIVWAALDCPSGIATSPAGAGRPVVLGRLTATIDGAVAGGRRYVVVGWARGVDGRKRHSSSAIFTAAGEPVAWSEAVWIEPRAG